MTKQYNYFNVEIDKNIDKEFASLLEKQPYTKEEEIQQLFSHLAYVDKTQQEKNGKELDFVVFRLFAQKKVNLSSNLPKRKEPLARNTKKLYNYFVISLASLNTLEGEV